MGEKVVEKGPPSRRQRGKGARVPSASKEVCQIN